METKDIRRIYSILEKEVKKFDNPFAESVQEKYKDPFFVLVATILSARTLDKTTAKVCEKLFKEVKGINDLEKISISKLEKLLYPVGFYKTKAKHLKELPIVLKERYNGRIPEEIEQLLELPGVGRKTANLVVSVTFGKPGICVDTHVHRITNILGIVKTKTALETEMALRRILPKELWTKTNYLFVTLGQNICFSRKPNCRMCPIAKMCPFGLKKIK
ncbi:MAG TPA: endonuclease III [archaeon]|jgi:endonuclease III|nr:endonuclease III [archaeon]